MHVLLCLTCNPVSKGAGQKDWRWGLGECPFEVNPGSPEIQRGSGMNRDRDFIRIPAARETWNWKGGGWSRGFYKHRNSKLNLTWQAALTKVSRHSGDDSLRALVFYFYIYIYIYTAMVIGSRCGQWKGCRVSTQRRRPAPGEQNTATYLDHDG